MYRKEGVHMAKRFRFQTGTYARQEPRRGDIWLIVDRNAKHDARTQGRAFADSITGGTRTGIVVSNKQCNMFSPNVEVVFTTTQQKKGLPTHFMTESTPEPSTVLCEEIDTVPKRNLIKYYGTITEEETEKLDRCLRISLGL